MESDHWWLKGDVRRIKHQLRKLLIGLQSGENANAGIGIEGCNKYTVFLGHPCAFLPKMFIFFHP